jgi:hypothetical protein
MLVEMRMPEELRAADGHARIDALELRMLEHRDAVIDLPLVHRFTTGMYIRQIFMPAGALCTSKIHKVQHPFVVLTGKVSVYSPDGGVEHIAAPYIGITEPGTRRALYIHEDTVWVTFHPNPEDETDLEVVERRLIAPHTLPGGVDGYAAWRAALAGAETGGGLLPERVTGQLDYGGAP